MKVQCAHTEMVDVDLLVPHPLNPNKHGERQIEMLAKIMNHQGWRHPITVSKRSGFIVAGHGRLMAAKKLGWTQAPVDRQEFDTEADEYAHLIADNKIAELAEHDDLKMFDDLKKFPDLDLDLLGIPDFELPMPEIVPGCDADDVPEALPEPKVVRGEVYILGNHRLMCGDSTAITDVERLMNGEKADMVFTDPPYGVAVVNTQGGILGDQDLTVFKDCLPLLKSFSKENSHTYIWCASGDMFPDSIAAFREVFQFQNILPIRCTHENKRGKKGAFKLNFETCLFANDNTKTFNPSKKFSVSETTLNDPRYKGDGKLRVYPALWDGERSTEHNMNIVHPTQKKVEMIEFYVEISSNENEILIDLFGGSGSTLIACEKTNRKCFMMELDPHYCAVILDRWQKFTGKKAHREDGVAWDEIRQ